MTLRGRSERIKRTRVKLHWNQQEKSLHSTTFKACAVKALGLFVLMVAQKEKRPSC
jgi:hypothetical protein